MDRMVFKTYAHIRRGVLSMMVGLMGVGWAGPMAPQELRQMREEMVDNQLIKRGIQNSRVLEAMNSVERHLFVDPSIQSSAYEDKPLPIGHDQTISQPYIVACMTELLNPDQYDKVLEIGTGSGYQAAVLSVLVREVYSIEIVDELAVSAKKRLSDLGYDNVTVRSGDGYKGWPEKGPFDGIIVTAAPDHVPPALIDQLKVGGRLVIPVGALQDVQELQLIKKLDHGKIETSNIIPVRFVPFTRKRPLTD